MGSRGCHHQTEYLVLPSQSYADRMSLLRSPSKKQPTPLPSAEDSLLIPANPALVNPGSSPTSRGGILLNPLGGNKDSGSHLRGTSPGGGASASSSGGSRPARWLSRTASSMSSSTTATATSSTSDGTSVESSAATSVAPSNASSSSPSLKFAPLPVSGRKRSSSIACKSEQGGYHHSEKANITP